MTQISQECKKALNHAILMTQISQECKKALNHAFLMTQISQECKKALNHTFLMTQISQECKKALNHAFLMTQISLECKKALNHAFLVTQISHEYKKALNNTLLMTQISHPDTNFLTLVLELKEIKEGDRINTLNLGTVQSQWSLVWDIVHGLCFCPVDTTGKLCVVKRNTMWDWTTKPCFGYSYFHPIDTKLFVVNRNTDAGPNVWQRTDWTWGAVRCWLPGQV